MVPFPIQLTTSTLREVIERLHYPLEVMVVCVRWYAVYPLSLRLGDMERMVPWPRLIDLIEPHYPSSGRVGRPPIGVPRMLRMLRKYFLQQWYSLSDEALEDAIYDSQAMREFVGIELSRERVPDATTLLKFRRKLEDNQLTKAIFDEVNAHLSERGLLMREGTMVDHRRATIDEEQGARARPRDAPDTQG